MNFRSLSFFLVLSILLPSCVKRSGYKKSTLEPITQETMNYESQEDQLTFRAKIYSRFERAKLFDEKGRYLKGLVPIQISLENTGDECWYLNPNDINLELVHSGEIKKRLEHRTGLRTAGIIIGGALAAASCAVGGYFLSCLYIGCLGTSIVAGLSGLAGAGSFFIITPVCTHKSVKNDTEYNMEMYQDVSQKVFCDSVKISPKNKVELLIFVKYENMYRDFIVGLHNELNEKILFEVELCTV